MSRIAIPVFSSRVAPVLDASTRLLVIDCIQGREASRCLVATNGWSPLERIRAFERMGVSTLICGALSETLYRMIREHPVELVPGIAGDAEAVLAAFLGGRLHDPEFRMPGLPATTPIPVS